MRKRTRRVMFWLAVVLFGVASWVTVRLAQGYTFDLRTNQFVRTGAIGVTVNTDAKVFLDDQLVDTASSFSHRVVRDRLVPGTYAVRLLKDGWSSWHKTTRVDAGLLVDFPSVLLLPTDEESQPELHQRIADALALARTIADATPLPTPSPRPRKPAPPQVSLGDFILRSNRLLLMNTASGSLVADGVLGMALADDTSRILWWTHNELSVLWLRNTDYQPFRAEGEHQLITRFAVPIVRAAWFTDRDHIVVDLGSGTYRIVETDTRGGINIIRI